MEFICPGLFLVVGFTDGLLQLNSGTLLLGQLTLVIQQLLLLVMLYLYLFRSLTLLTFFIGINVVVTRIVDVLEPAGVIHAILFFCKLEILFHLLFIIAYK